MGRSTLDLVLGIAFIVIGILMVAGKTGIQAIFPFLGIALIVAGILILLGKLPGGTLIAVIALVIGILLVAGLLKNAIPDVIEKQMWIVNLVLGIVLIVVGIQRLR